MSVRKRISIFLLVIAIPASVGALVPLLHQAADSSWQIDEPLKIHIATAAGILLLSAYVLFKGLSARCPRCKGWWAKKEIGREVIDRTQSHRVVTLRTEYKDNQGFSHGHADREELKLVTIERHKCLNRCRDCRHQWLTYERVER